ncbi:SDR family oxidoreductase [Helicobacter anatolicus]|uniref:SDR family oxidoreductase n=1 Tax=Helicobacter anatolicus TaxID=2905874 RepID=UPI001E42AE26|nr:SDR family oxidoreductase [Helicobacter anatolicus]MCE3038661.1 SDR family oxidoreductase [Helicobacter anatolicus]
MKDRILIIGASSDLGRELIEKIKNENTEIIAHFYRKPIEKENGILPLCCDLSDIVEVEKFIGQVLDIGLPNKMVFLAAERVKNIRFKDLNWNDFSLHLHIGLRAYFLILQAILPKLSKDKEKSKKVVFMLSSCVLNMPPLAMSAYVSAKYALLGLMKSLVSEYRNANIQINAISPSMIETSFLEHIDPKIVELNAYNHPLKRNAIPQDIVPWIEMLLSEKSDYLNGVNLPITGGENF